MSAFVLPNQLAEVKFYIKNTFASIKIVKPDVYCELSGAEKADYEEAIVKIRPLTWGKACEIQSAAHIYDQVNNLRTFDSDKFVKLKLIAVLAEWTFKTRNIKNDMVVAPICEEAVNALHPAVADFILKEYHERFEYNETKRRDS
jgi:hypothetical protein